MRWVVGIISFFVVVATVNGFVAYFAINGRSELIETQPYEKGLVYQSTIDELQRAHDAGLTLVFAARQAEDPKTRDLELQVLDQSGTRLEDATLHVDARFLPASKYDFTSTLTELEPGLYHGNFLAEQAGIWLFNIAATKDGSVYRWKQKEVIR